MTSTTVTPDRWIPPCTVNEMSVDLDGRPHHVEVEARFGMDGNPNGASLLIDFRQSNPPEATVLAAFAALRAQGCTDISVRCLVTDDGGYGGLYAEAERDLTDDELERARRVADRQREKTKARAAAELERIRSEWPELAGGEERGR